MAADYKEKKRDLTVIDRLALCGVAVMGKDYALEAYKMSHKIKTDNPASLGVMVSRWLNSNKAKEFLNEVKQLYADTLLANADEGEELSERQLTRIIERGIVSEKDAKKQADMSLKLMAWRKEAQEEKGEEKRRKYIIPYHSKCNICQIMGFFLEMKKGEILSKDDFDAIASRGIERQLQLTRRLQTEARERVKAGKPLSGEGNYVEGVARMFMNLLTWEDVLDIYYYFQSMRKGSSETVPYWKK